MSCYDHHICGSFLAEDVVVCFRGLQIPVDDIEKFIIAAFHVSDGIDCCCVGFLRSEQTKFNDLDARILAHISSVCPGSSGAVIIS